MRLVEVAGCGLLLSSFSDLDGSWVRLRLRSFGQNLVLLRRECAQRASGFEMVAQLDRIAVR